MHFPKFWAQGKFNDFTCWRWSDFSATDAQQKAAEAAQSLAAKFTAGKFDRRQNRYDYGERPLREAIISEERDPTGGVFAILTRNSYGSLILNSSRVMFLDIDVQPAQSRVGKGFSSFIRGLFGGGVESPKPIGSADQALARIRDWIKLNSSWGLRVYKTAGGLRAIATQALFDPSQVGHEQVFEALDVDPIYRKLCENQKSFRARLTPKPWRCSLSVPPTQWPFETSESEKSFQKWEKDYVDACEDRATCQFVEAIGSANIHPEVIRVIAIHDQHTKASSGLPLA